MLNRRFTYLLTVIMVSIFILSCGTGLKIIRFTPKGQSDRETAIQVKFSEPVIKDKRDINNIITNKEYIKFNPPIKGEYRWISEDTLVFIPNEKLGADVEYMAEVKKGIYDLIKLKGKNKFAFKTPKFSVISADMYFDYFIFNIGEKNIICEIQFNYQVDTEDVKNYVKLLRNGTDFPYEIVSVVNNRQFRLVSANIKKEFEDQVFSLEIDPNLPNSESGTILEKKIIKKITLKSIPPFVFRESRVERMGRENVIVLRFNKIPDERLIETYIQVLDKDVKYSAKVDISRVILSGNFKLDKSYHIKIKKGLKSVDSSELKKDHEFRVHIPRPKREIRFVQEGKLLPIKDNVNILVKTYEIKNMNLQIYRVPYNNVAFLMHNPSLKFLGRIVFATNIDVKVENDGSALTEVNLKSFIKKYGKGMYNIRIMDNSRGWPRVNKWLIGTDIGLVAKDNGNDLMVFTGSLKTFQAVPGVQVSLLNKEGEIGTSGKSDKNGIIVFKDYNKEFENGIPWLITAESSGDYSYLFFNDAKILFTKFDIDGDIYKKGILEAFVYPSRDLFRPGEEIHLAAVVKKIGGGNLNKFPVRLKVFNPMAISIYEERGVLNSIGMIEYSFKFPSNVKTGTYVASLYAGDELKIGSTKFKIEEFIPQTLKVSIDVDEKKLGKGYPLIFKVKGINLFGSPAASRKVFSSVHFSYLPFKPKGYDGFSFINSRFTYSGKKVDLDETNLDDAGIIKYECPVPFTGLTHGMLKARIYSEVQQKGGRTVAVVKNVKITDKPYYLGVKRIGDSFSTTDTLNKFEIVSLNDKEKPVTVKNVSVYIVKKGWYNIYQRTRWRQSGRYESDDYQEIVLRKNFPVLKGKASFTFKHKNPGSYEVIVIQEKDRISANQEYFVSGKGEVSIDLSESYKLKLKLNKTEYKSGETAQVSVQTPFKGLLMLTVERDRVLYRKFVKINNYSQIISIPILKSYLPNAYVVGILFRSYDDINPAMPMKAYAAAPLKIDQSTMKLDLNIKCPEKIKPNSKINVTIEANHPEEETYITLSLVEEGVLNITGFHVPKIFNYFTRKRALSVSSYDTFSHVVNALADIEAGITIGGGVYETSDKHHSPIALRKRKTIMHWSGIVKLINGKCSLNIPIGNYNGSLRVMAVAASKKRYGSAEKNILSYSPVVIQPVVPRTVAPNDIVSIPVSIFNKTGKQTKINFSMTTKGPFELIGIHKKEFNLKNEEEVYADFRLKAKDSLGSSELIFTAKFDEESVTIEDYIGIRPATIKETIISSGIIKPNSKIKIGKTGEYYEIGKIGKLFIAPYPEAKYIGRLDDLLRYPYGCIEQKISVAFPQLYITEISKAVSPFLYKTKKAEAFVREGIRSAEIHFNYKGFELWPGYEASPYLKLYVTHFLVEAKMKKFGINERVYNNSLKRAHQYVRQNLDYNISGSELFNVCYALYILSNAKKPVRESMEYIKEIVLKNNVNVISFLYLAAAYSKIGDKDTALSIIEKKKDILLPEKFGWWRNPYISDTSTMAMLVLTLMEIKPSHPKIKTYLNKLIRRFNSSRRLNTHEKSLCLQVFSKFFSSDKIANKQLIGSIYYSDKIKKITGNNFIFEDKQISGNSFQVENKGKNKIYYSYLSEAFPGRYELDEPENHGFNIDRDFYDMNGSQIDFKNVKQGSLVIEKINVTTKNAGNAVIVCLFPGGFELENPRLKSSTEIDWIPNYQNNRSDYIDIREDRLLIFTDFNRSSGSRQYYFAYRAVFPGEFVVPYLLAEDMYQPDIYGTSKSGRVFIIPTE